MTDCLRVVVGRGPPGRGAHATLALQIIDRARAAGFEGFRVRASRCSMTRHVELDDAKGRRWLLRISTHRRPTEIGTLIPHLDLVSLDGVAGVAEAERFLLDAATGTIAWHAPRRDRYRRRVR